MATNENEVDVIVGDKFECKVMNESNENMSTESADKSDSGIQTESLSMSDTNEMCIRDR